MTDPATRALSPLTRRDALRLSAAAGIGAAWMRSRAAPVAASNPPSSQLPRCGTPESAVAKTAYGKVRGYLEGGVLNFKGIPYGQDTGGENRWLPCKPPLPWEGER